MTGPAVHGSRLDDFLGLDAGEWEGFDENVRETTCVIIKTVSSKKRNNQD